MGQQQGLGKVAEELSHPPKMGSSHDCHPGAGRAKDSRVLALRGCQGRQVDLIWWGSGRVGPCGARQRGRWGFSLSGWAVSITVCPPVSSLSGARGGARLRGGELEPWVLRRLGIWVTA